jgi:phospholipase C
VLKARAALGAAGSTAGLGARSRSPAAGRAGAARLSDIADIVILMQENRSSDGSFDTYPNLRGFDDRLERT